MSVRNQHSENGSRKPNCAYDSGSQGCFCTRARVSEENWNFLQVTIDGYTDFIFVNRFGECQHHSTINKGIDRIIRDCNEEQLAKCESGTIKPKNLILLPKFSCHSLRHTCATRLCEAGINMKVIQDVLGHADITTTMNIYTEATKNLKKKEIDKFAEFLSATTTFEGKEEND